MSTGSVTMRIHTAIKVSTPVIDALLARLKDAGYFLTNTPSLGEATVAEITHPCRCIIADYSAITAEDSLGKLTLLEKRSVPVVLITEDEKQYISAPNVHILPHDSNDREIIAFIENIRSVPTP